MSSERTNFEFSRHVLENHKKSKNQNKTDRHTENHATYRENSCPSVSKSKQSSVMSKRKGKSGKNPKKGKDRGSKKSLDQNKPDDKTRPQRKPPTRPTPPPDARMICRRDPGCEGASKNLREYFSGKFYEARLCRAVEEFRRNIWPPLLPDRRTRLGVIIHQRLKRALAEMLGLRRILGPEHKWMKPNKFKQYYVIDTIDLTPPGDAKVRAGPSRPQQVNNSEASLLTYLPTEERYKMLYNQNVQVPLDLNRQFYDKEKERKIKKECVESAHANGEAAAAAGLLESAIVEVQEDTEAEEEEEVVVVPSDDELVVVSDDSEDEVKVLESPKTESDESESTDKKRPRPPAHRWPCLGDGCHP